MSEDYIMWPKNSKTFKMSKYQVGTNNFLFEDDSTLSKRFVPGQNYYCHC